MTTSLSIPLRADAGLALKPGHEKRAGQLGRALAVALVFFFTAATGEARADCTPDSATAQTGDTVTCSDDSLTGFEAGAGVEDLRIVVEAGSTIQNPIDGAAAIQINTNNPGDMGAAPIVPGVSILGLIVVSGDGSAGIRATGSGGPTDLNYVRNQGFIQSVGSNTGDDVIGIDLGDRGVVEHLTDISDAQTEAITLHGDRNIGIRVGDDGRIEVAAPISVGDFSGGGVATDESPVGVQLGDGIAATGGGLLVSDTITTIGTDARGAVVGSGWTGVTGIIHVNETGRIRARGDDAIGLLVGDDNSVFIEGIVAGLGDNAIGIFMGDQTIANPAAALVVTGSVVAQFTDATAVSLGSKKAAAGTTIVDSFTPSMQIGTLSTLLPANGTPGTIVGNPESGALVVFRDETSELNHLLISDRSQLVANENSAFEPGRAIAIEGTDGAERIDNYGDLGGKIFLRGGDDIVHMGPGSRHVGFMSVNGGSGFDTLELSNRWSVPTDGTPTELDLSRFRDFEHAQVADGAFRLRGSFAGASPGATLRVEDTGELVIRDLLRIDGSVDFAPGSTFTVEISSLTADTPYLESNSAITIESDAPDLLTSTLNVELSGPVDSGTFTLISGASLTGQFEVVNLPDEAIFSFVDVVYDPLAGTLVLDIDRDPYAYNREVTNAYVFALENAGPAAELQTFLDALTSLPLDEYLTALDQIQPEIYDTHSSLQLALARQFQQAMLERAGHCIAASTSGKRDPRTKVPCRPRPLDVWVSGYGLFRDRDGKTGNVSWKDSGGGVVMGVDHRRGDSLLFSASVGGAHGSSDLDRGDRGTLSTIDIGTLAAWSRGPALVQGFFGYGHGWNESDRSVAFTGITPTSYGAKYGTNRVSAGTELRWTFALPGLDLSPVVDVDWARIMRPGFDESGGGVSALAVQSANDDVVTVRAGFELGTSVLRKGYWTDFLEKADGIWQPELSVLWRQTVAGNTRGLTSSFIGAPTSSGTSTVFGDDANQGFEIGVGAWFTPVSATRISLGARYDAFVWTNIVSHDFKATVAYSF